MYIAEEVLQQKTSQKFAFDNKEAIGNRKVKLKCTKVFHHRVIKDCQTSHKEHVMDFERVLSFVYYSIVGKLPTAETT